MYAYSELPLKTQNFLFEQFLTDVAIQYLVFLWNSFLWSWAYILYTWEAKYGE